MLRVGSRAQVIHGNAKMTGGGLKKKDLKYNKQGKIVSKKMSTRAKKEKRLQKAGYTTKKGQFGAVRIMKGGGKLHNFDEKTGYSFKIPSNDTIGLLNDKFPDDNIIEQFDGLSPDERTYTYKRIVYELLLPRNEKHKITDEMLFTDRIIPFSRIETGIYGMIDKPAVQPGHHTKEEYKKVVDQYALNRFEKNTVRFNIENIFAKHVRNYGALMVDPGHAPKKKNSTIRAPKTLIIKELLMRRYEIMKDLTHDVPSEEIRNSKAYLLNLE